VFGGEGLPNSVNFRKNSEYIYIENHHIFYLEPSRPKCSRHTLNPRPVFILFITNSVKANWTKWYKILDHNLIEKNDCTKI